MELAAKPESCRKPFKIGGTRNQNMRDAKYF
jgi:hypothetical protein